MSGDSVTISMDVYTASIVKDAIVHEIHRMAQTMTPTMGCDDITHDMSITAGDMDRLRKVFYQLEDGGVPPIEEKSQS